MLISSELPLIAEVMVPALLSVTLSSVWLALLLIARLWPSGTASVPGPLMALPVDQLKPPAAVSVLLALIVRPPPVKLVAPPTIRSRSMVRPLAL